MKHITMATGIIPDIVNYNTLCIALCCKIECSDGRSGLIAAFGAVKLDGPPKNAPDEQFAEP